MSELKVCRICLSNESKFYGFDEYDLKSFYENVTSYLVPSKDGLPQYVCYECAALLYKFHRFKEKCIEGHNVLKGILQNGPITYAGVSELNTKKVHKCQHRLLEILVTTDRVKTYNIQHSSLCKVENYERLKEEVVLDEYSDGKFSDNDDYDLNDPERDPVSEELTFDMLNLKPEQQGITNDNKETVIVVDLDTKPVLPENILLNEFVDTKPNLEKTGRVLEKHKHVNTHKKVIKTKTTKKTRQTRKRKKKNSKHSAKNYSDVDSDSSTEVLSKLKKRKKKEMPTIPSETAENYKFNKPKKRQKNLAFLDSGFWKKSSLTEEEALDNFEAKARDKKYLNAAYKCTDCYRGFSQYSMLERHIPLRHGDAAGKLICRFCKMRFKSSFFLNKHMRQHYTKYECLRCDLVCTLETSALFHEEYHNGVIRKCPHCDKEFKHLSTFYTHLRTHRSKHICSLCGESFVSELGLRLHAKAKHSTATEQPPLNIVEENTYCDVCQMKFETKDAFDKHLSHSALHTDLNRVDINVMKDLIEEDEEKTEVGKTDENRTETEELHKRRSRVETMLCAIRKSHLPRKISKKPTTCHHCGKHFETQSACMKHHLAMHPRTSFFSPKDRVICEICGASLAPGSVASHLNQHTRSKMYTCDTCGRSFTTSTMLRTHMVTHTGEKKFACSLCDKRFTQNGSLSLHYRTFHLKQPYPKRNRRKKVDKPVPEGFSGKEE